METEPAIAISRLMARNNLTKEESEKRLASQHSNEWRRGFASVVLTNNGDQEALEKECDRLISGLNAAAAF